MTIALKELKALEKYLRNFLLTKQNLTLPPVPPIRDALLCILQVKASQVPLDDRKFWIPAEGVFSDPELAHLWLFF